MKSRRMQLSNQWPGGDVAERCGPMLQEGWIQRDLVGGRGCTSLKNFLPSARQPAASEFHCQALLVLKLHLCYNNNVTVFVAKLH